MKNKILLIIGLIILTSLTGVNYIATKYGITPRLNADESIHLTNKETFGKNK